MTTDEFLSHITYSENNFKNWITVYWKDLIIADISFEDTPNKLEDEEYCSNLAEEVAIESSLFNKLVKED